MSTIVQHEMLDAEVFPPGAGLDWYGAALPDGGLGFTRHHPSHWPMRYARCAI